MLLLPKTQLSVKRSVAKIILLKSVGREQKDAQATGQEISVTGPLNLHLIMAVPQRFAEQVALIRYADK